jgi:hypothetical protein
VDLALARIRDNVSQLRGPIQRSAHEGLSLAWRGKIPNLRYCLAAALSVALIGIAVNALVLQRERHPAPLFGLAEPKPPAAAPAPPTPPPPKPVSDEHDAPPAPSNAALPPARPADPAAVSAPASDPIADLLAGEANSDASRLTLTAQTALAKLGYPVKPDGKEGAATEQALRDFERAHGLPLGTDITERLVKQLTQAARGGGH